MAEENNVKLSGSCFSVYESIIIFLKNLEAFFLRVEMFLVAVVLVEVYCKWFYASIKSHPNLGKISPYKIEP
jgi:hypothetical protein